MIASGEKKEEYRETKLYWLSRLCNLNAEVEHCGLDYKYFDVIVFKNGYAKNAPTIRVEHIETYWGKAKPEWSDNWQGDVFVIKLGDIN
jgi:hypothetical protein